MNFKNVCFITLGQRIEVYEICKKLRTLKLEFIGGRARLLHHLEHAQIFELVNKPINKKLLQISVCLVCVGKILVSFFGLVYNQQTNTKSDQYFSRTQEKEKRKRSFYAD